MMVGSFRSQQEIEEVLEAPLDIANRMGVSVNLTKLKAYHITLVEGTLRCAAATLHTKIGSLHCSMDGFKTVGLPWDNLSLVLSKFATKLRAVRASILRHGPTCILALRVLLSFAISSMEYGLTLNPLLRPQLAPL
jgi:hypothetical protein